jgi:hypothetical protein
MHDEMTAFAINAREIHKLFSSHQRLKKRIKALE